MNIFVNISGKLKLNHILIVSIIFLCFSCEGSNDVKVPAQSTDEEYNDGAVDDSNGRLLISQYNITWHFDRSYQWGQFANGDYWVVGPVGIIGISPESTEVSGRVINGSMVNPLPGDQQGYDSAIGDTYSASLNLGRGISSTNPLVLQNGTSLVSSISWAAATPGNRPQLTTAAVLTILSSAPASGSFRPTYCGTDKTVRFNESQLNYDLLARLNPVENTPLLSDIERKFERVWLDHIGGWVGRALHPVENMPDYGSIIAGEVSDGALMLHLNFTNEQKRTLLIRYVQLGIDNFGIIQSGGQGLWEPDGGHCGGRKWPILFAGIILNDNSMKAVGQKSGNYLYTSTYGPGNVPPDYVHFQEDGQTFYVTAADVALSSAVNVYHSLTFYGHYYPPDELDLPEYLSSDIGMPEWGIRHSTIPLWDGNAWEVTYRPINAYAWAGFILSARIMNANTPQLWNHEAIFDYEDRHMAVTAQAGLTPAWRYSVSYWGVWGSEEGSWRTVGKFMGNMWDTYRSSY